MRLVPILLIFVFSVSKQSTVLTGVVLSDNESISNCRIEVLESGESGLTDSQGKFKLTIEGLDKVTLIASYIDGLTYKTVIQEIELQPDELDLGYIPLFFHQTISVSDYEKLKSKEKEEYDEVRHWVQLIGYISKINVDTAAVRSTFWTHRKIKYQIDTVDKKVTVNYKDWRK